MIHQIILVLIVYRGIFSEVDFTAWREVGTHTLTQKYLNYSNKNNPPVKT